MEAKKFYLGIDAGTTYIKAAIVNEHEEMIGSFVHPTGPDHSEALQTTWGRVLQAAELTREAVAHTTATGFGRYDVAFADSVKTEISCHARGAFHHFRCPITIIDIGGQDTKIIRVDGSGKRIGFRMNRKCAAGTGAFLEEIARHLQIPMEELNSMAGGSKDDAPLNSFCTVFASTEVINRLKDGEAAEVLVRGAFESVARRVMEMEELQGTIVMTGGVVAYNPVILKVLGRHIGQEILTPPHPQLTGAFGAALYANDASRQ